MTRDEFQEALLVVMEQKVHWAWPSFTDGSVDKAKLHIHLENEYATYVRDFPVLVARAYVQCPIPEARRELIENVYEEETGGLAAGRPHPELFLLYPKGLGMDLSRFTDAHLLPEARVYRSVLDDLTQGRGWDVAATVTTLFLEGTPNERAGLERPGDDADEAPLPPLEEHPLVKHYGLPFDALALTRAHRSVEGDHRKAAWRILLDHIPAERRALSVAALETTLAAWLIYRDAVALACGLNRADTSSNLR